MVSGKFTPGLSEERHAPWSPGDALSPGPWCCEKHQYSLLPSPPLQTQSPLVWLTGFQANNQSTLSDKDFRGDRPDNV